MIKDMLRWVVPGAITVLCGTPITVAMTTASIEQDLLARGQGALDQRGYSWADLRVDGRSLSLTGTTTLADEIGVASGRLASLPGVATVFTNVTVAPLAQPFRTTFSTTGQGTAVTGIAPDIASRERLATVAGVDPALLELRSGMTNRTAWLAGALFAVEHLPRFDTASIRLTDLSLDIEGRARSARDYRDLQIILRAGPPAGVALGQVTVIPPLVEPYQWHAKFDGQRIDISGYVPDVEFAGAYRTAALAVPVATGVGLGSGEPEGFMETSMLLVEQLSRLDYGAASITGAEISLTGAPPTAEVAEDVITRLAQTGSIIVLEPPRVDDYWVSASLQPGGTLVFDGYAPDQGFRDRFAAVPGADVSWLKLGRGEPERYAAHVDFGLSVLERLAAGRFSLRENVAVITGTAATATDYLALRALREQGPPQGMVLAMFDVKAPPSGNYRWQAAKSSSGEVGFSGLLPSPDVEASLSARAGIVGLSGVGYASGEPANFAVMAETALTLLDRLTEGKVEFDGRGWTLTGTPKSLTDHAALESDFTARQLAASGWSMALAALPEPTVAPPSTAAEKSVEEADATELVVAQAEVATEAPAEAAAPATELDPNYAFSVTLAADATAVVAGQLPSPATLQFVSSALADANTDAVSIAPGAPATFGASLQTGLRALGLLSEGSLDFSEGRWRLSGTAPTPEAEGAATALLGADPGPWDTEIVAPAQAVAEAAPAEPPAAPSSAGAELCESALASFSARNAILFQSGAATISANSDAALDELAQHLAVCPEALVHVEGHTDADGDETLNLALSVARAEAVVAGLVERGVAPQRLYALGFGEAMPIAPNDTADGKRQNRRIVVKLAGSDS